MKMKGNKIRYMNSDRRSALSCALFDRYIGLQRKGVKTLKTYEIEFKNIIERVCPDKAWNQITKCDIHEHLCQYTSPKATIIEILKNLMED